MSRHARSTDPETSHIAAAMSAPNAASLQARYLAELRAVGNHGLTSRELSERTGIDRVTVSPELRPMARKGLVLDSGRKRLGPNGYPSIVWVAA